MKIFYPLSNIIVLIILIFIVNIAYAGGSGEVSFSNSIYTIDEDAGSANITIRRNNGSAGAISVRCNTSNGTANAGSDYTATTDTLTWTDGDSSNKTCTIPISNDAVPEGSETVNLSLSNITGGASLGSPNTAILTINDSLTPGDVSFSSASYTVDEDVGTASLTIIRSNGSDGAISARCNTSNGTANAGSDYTATTDTLTWADGDSSNKTCTIPISNDAVLEGSETVNLSLSNITGGASLGSPNTAILTINEPTTPVELLEFDIN